MQSSWTIGRIKENMTAIGMTLAEKILPRPMFMDWLARSVAYCAGARAIIKRTGLEREEERTIAVGTNYLTIKPHNDFWGAEHASSKLFEGDAFMGGKNRKEKFKVQASSVREGKAQPLRALQNLLGMETDAGFCSCFKGLVLQAKAILRQDTPDLA